MSDVPDKILSVRNLYKSYSHALILEGVTLEIHKGEVLALMGRSGSGKSTLLRCIHLLEDFEKGEIILDGEKLGYRQKGNRVERLSDEKLARQRIQIGMVFQHFALFHHMTILENIIEGPVHVKKIPKKQAIDEACAILDEVGMLKKKDAYPLSLSGGQQQRAGIARALTMRPKLMLFDEPTSALDPELVAGILELMKKIAHDGMSMLVVTHEIEFAREVSSQIAFLHKGQIVEKGPLEKIFQSPDHPETRLFLRSIL